MKEEILKALSVILMLIACPFVKAENPDSEWQATLFGGLYLNNEQAWQVEPNVSWFFNKYIGIGAGLELTAQYNQPSRMTVIDGHEAVLAKNERNVAWIILKPSVIFRSPTVWKTTDEYFRLWFQAEPGLSFACPFRNSLTYDIKAFNYGPTIGSRRFLNKGLQWFYWNARVSINFSIDEYIIGVGYSLSNLDYYSGRRNIVLANGEKYHVPKKELSQSIYLSIGYTF